MKRTYTLCFAAVALVQAVMACSWIPIPFCGTSNARPDDVVLSGKIVNVDMDGIELEVIDVFAGSESRDTIRIWDGTDWDCNGLFSMAASDLGGVHDSIVVILPLIGTIENTWDVLGDYRRPDYFEYEPYLRISDGLVIGYINGPPGSPMYEMPYADLLALWNDGTGGCSDVSVDGVRQAQPFEAHLVHSMLNLTVPSDMASMSTIRILAVNGHEVLALKSAPGTTWIDLGGFAAGVYHIVLVQRDGTRAFARVMKL